MTTDHFGDASSVELRVAGIFPLGREDKEDVLTNSKTTRLHGHKEFFLRGSRVGSAFQANQLTGPEMGENGVAGSPDVTQIRLMVLIQRGGNTNDDDVNI